MPCTKNIFVFGDSIGYGEWDKNGGYIERLKKFYHSKFLPNPDKYFLIHNLSVPGHCSTEILIRFEKEILIRQRENSDNIFIFAIGVNDAAIIKTKNASRTNIKQFEKNIFDIIKLAQKYSNKIFFIGLFPVDENEIDKKSDRENWEETFRNKNIEEFNFVLKKICKQNDIFFYDFFDDFSQNDYIKNLDDGIHPNTLGHEIIFDKIKFLNI